MKFPLEIAIFGASLAGIVGGSVLLSGSIRALGQIYSMPEQFVGFVTALGADSPEITSALVAMLSGQQDVGAGVVFGSNLFNLASLLGLAAIVAGKVAVRRGTVLLNGAVGLGVTGLAVLLAAGWGPRWVLVLLIGAIGAPYVLLLWMSTGQIHRLPIPGRWAGFLAAATAEEEGAPTYNPPSAAKAFVRTGVALGLIVAGSVGLVPTTTDLTSGWLPHALLGPIVLAALTGIPNLYTSARLAVLHKGGAVLAEAMNSNLLNIVAGLAVPTLLLGGMRLAQGAGTEIVWLLALTVAATGMAAWRGGLTRWEGAAVVAAYLAFVGMRIHSAL